MLCSKSRSCLLCFRLYLSLAIIPVKCLRSTGFSILLVLTLFLVGLSVLFPSLLKWPSVD